MIKIIEIIVSLIPVFIFLAALMFLDSYKLIKLQAILKTILIGGLSAIVSLLINIYILENYIIELSFFTRYMAPVIEEFCKVLFIVYLIKSNRVGFIVDAAIYGFAVGVGFAQVENIYYLWAVDDPNIFLWVIRGFGTAATHCATVSIFSIISKSLYDRTNKKGLYIFLPGLLAAILIHSAFNHFILPPEIMTVVLLVSMTLIVVTVFEYSEKITRKWLGSGLDANMILFEALTSGKILETKIGVYLDSLNDRFDMAVVADMYCYLRLHVEIALKARGVLLSRNAGLKLEPDPEIKEKFKELKFLEKSIGTTGKLALQPFMKTSNRDLWQIHILN